ncbi:quinone oxidoreductase family protein [Micromonospora siamensis]|uniref:NADPH:quinone reductase n=1 Tax=Micromonospora siamensis TaxID=299152 RepID=A0A1C5INB0_9ACTN|nr:zinc-binding dehydrogenase [Micromonospora siamensis]SCG59785.1 NADPH:quinone reductase [Micromonospora siamensis]
MRRIRYHEYGGPEVLRLEEAPEPVPAPGELLVRTSVIGVTLPGVRRVRGDGASAPLPAVLGGEVAGRVTAVGADVTGFAVGDRVTALAFAGAYADTVVVPATMASLVPDGAADSLAVALVRSGHVALGVLATAAVAEHESVLVTGAASGVGHLAVQLARLAGAARVVAAVSSPAKAPFLRGLGADEVVTYDDGRWGEPVDVVLDGVGGDLLPRALAAVRPGGRLVYFASGGGTVSASDLLAGAKTVTGFATARFAATRPDEYAAHHRRLWELALAGRLRPAVHAELPLTAAAEAHRIIEARANLGKVVLRP